MAKPKKLQTDNFARVLRLPPEKLEARRITATGFPYSSNTIPLPFDNVHRKAVPNVTCFTLAAFQNP